MKQELFKEHSYSVFAGDTGPNCERTEAWQEFDDIISKFLVEQRIPGASIAVSHNGNILYQQGYGMAGGSRRVHCDSVFRIASISKPITAAIVLKLCHEQKISLDSKVFGKNGILCKEKTKDKRMKSITIRHLLQHSAGWDRDKVGDAVFVRPQCIIQQHPDSSGYNAALMSYALRRKLQFTPGTWHSYSNLGYLVLGEIIEALSGQPYHSLLMYSMRELDIHNLSLGKRSRAQWLSNEVEYFNNREPQVVDSIYPGEGLVLPQYGGMAMESSGSYGGLVSDTESLVKFLHCMEEAVRTADSDKVHAGKLESGEERQETTTTRRNPGNSLRQEIRNDSRKRSAFKDSLTGAGNQVDTREAIEWPAIKEAQIDGLTSLGLEAAQAEKHGWEETSVSENTLQTSLHCKQERPIGEVTSLTPEPAEVLCMNNVLTDPQKSMANKILDQEGVQVNALGSSCRNKQRTCHRVLNRSQSLPKQSIEQCVVNSQQQGNTPVHDSCQKVNIIHISDSDQRVDALALQTHRSQSLTPVTNTQNVEIINACHFSTPAPLLSATQVVQETLFSKHRPTPAPLLNTTQVQETLARPHYENGRDWYGLGWDVQDEGKSWGHTGGMEGSCGTIFHHKSGLNWAFLLNSWAVDCDLNGVVKCALCSVPGLDIYNPKVLSCDFQQGLKIFTADASQIILGMSESVVSSAISAAKSCGYFVSWITVTRQNIACITKKWVHTAAELCRTCKNNCCQPIWETETRYIVIMIKSDVSDYFVAFNKSLEELEVLIDKCREDKFAISFLDSYSDSHSQLKYIAVFKCDNSLNTCEVSTHLAMKANDYVKQVKEFVKTHHIYTQSVTELNGDLYVSVILHAKAKPDLQALTSSAVRAADIDNLSDHSVQVGNWEVKSHAENGTGSLTNTCDGLNIEMNNDVNWQRAGNTGARNTQNFPCSVGKRTHDDAVGGAAGSSNERRSRKRKSVIEKSSTSSASCIRLPLDQLCTFSQDSGLVLSGISPINSRTGKTRQTRLACRTDSVYWVQITPESFLTELNRQVSRCNGLVYAKFFSAAGKPYVSACWCPQKRGNCYHRTSMSKYGLVPELVEAASFNVRLQCLSEYQEEDGALYYAAIWQAEDTVG